MIKKLFRYLLILLLILFAVGLTFEKSPLLYDEKYSKFK
jgi:hypothetical protein